MYPHLFTERVEHITRSLNALLARPHELTEPEIYQVRRMLDELSDEEARILRNTPCAKGGLCFKWNNAKAYAHYLTDDAATPRERMFGDLSNWDNGNTPQGKNQKMIGDLIKWRCQQTSALV